jgi:hypothetical protein
MTPPNVEYVTRCRVPGCSKTFVSDPFDVPIIGQPTDRLDRFVRAMESHLKERHPQQLTAIDGSAAQFKILLIASSFEIRDPLLISMGNMLRWSLAQFTRTRNITDAEITDRAARLELEPEQQEGIETLLRDMRDLLTEQGSYAPPNGQPAPSPLITP